MQLFNFTRLIYLSFFLGLIFYSPRPIPAWESNVHRSITKDAIVHCPPDLRDLLIKWDDLDREFKLSEEVEKIYKERGMEKNLKGLAQNYYPPFTEKRRDNLIRDLTKLQKKKKPGGETGHGGFIDKWPKGALERGAIQPDHDFRDYFNHIMHTRWLDTPRKKNLESQKPKEILGFELREYLPYKIHQGSAGLRGNGAPHIAFLAEELALKLKEGKLSEPDLIWGLGVIAHYVADLNQPLHCCQKKDLPYEKKYHNTFEQDLMKNLSRAKNIHFGFNTKKNPPFKATVEDLKKSLFPGIQVIDNIQSYFEDKIRKLFQFGFQLDKAYISTEGDKVKKTDGWEKVEPLAYGWYSQSVTDVALIWTTIWVKGGKMTKNTSIEKINPLLNQEKLQKSLFAMKGVKFNINQCTTGDLQSIRGIGKKTAQKIIQNRPYKTWEEVENLFTAKKVQTWKEKFELP